MIPTVVIRADNGFGCPLLDAYADACLRAAEQWPDLAPVLNERASQARQLSLEFQAWGDLNADRVSLTRTLTPPRDPGMALWETRRRLRERGEAHERDLAELRSQLRETRQLLAQSEAKRAELSVKLERSRPAQHVTMAPTPR